MPKSGELSDLPPIWIASKQMFLLDENNFCSKTIPNNAEFTFMEKILKRKTFTCFKKFPLFIERPFFLSLYIYIYIYSAAMECLGPSTRRHRDWFDENHAHLAHQHDPQCTTKKDALRSMRRTMQLKPCKMQDSWPSARVDEI